MGSSSRDQANQDKEPQTIGERLNEITRAGIRVVECRTSLDNFNRNSYRFVENRANPEFLYRFKGDEGSEYIVGDLKANSCDEAIHMHLDAFSYAQELKLPVSPKEKFDSQVHVIEDLVRNRVYFFALPDKRYLI